jgi:predicted outer membrane repeat protein
VQAAVNAAAAAPGADTILVARNQAYLGQEILINSQTLTLGGGLANCSAPPDTTATVLSGAGGAALPVLRINTTGDAIVTLHDLQVTGGDTGAGGGGGGILYLGSNSSRLQIERVTVSGNSADNGGGIYALGNGSRAHLILGASTLVASNVARVSGGGIFLNNADLEMEGSGSAIANNTADDFGGGLRAIGPSEILITSGGIGTLGTIFGNEARIGGGIAIQGSSTTVGYVLLDLVTVDPQAPVRVRGNVARELGGGIHARPEFASQISRTYVTLEGVSIEENTAPSGAAVQLGTASSVFFTVGGDLKMIPSAACGANDDCNRVVDNESETIGGVPTTGGILVAGDAARIDLQGTRISGNVGGPPVYSDDPFSEDPFAVTLHQVVIADNVVDGEALVRVVSGLSTRIIDSTFAGNALTGGHILRTAGTTTLDGSILWQPGKTTLLSTASIIGRVLASETASLAGAEQVIGADPRFIDRANGNYRLRAASQAIDVAPAVTGDDRDADGLPRDQDLASVSNGVGVRDLGAYERQGLLPLVLNGGFDSDVRLWPEVVAGASAHQAEDYAGISTSGSLRVTETGGSIRVLRARRQCVELPFASTYRLNGYGRGYSVALFRDTLSIEWRLRADSADCSGPVLREGALGLPNNTTWASAPQPASISIAATEWTRNSTLEIELVATDDQVLPPNNISVAFDQVTLTELGLPDLIFANGFQ